MSIITRSIRNTTSTQTTITLLVPGYDTEKPAVVINYGQTLDLFTVLTVDQLEAIQSTLSQYVSLGQLAVTATVDTATFSPIGGGPLASVSLTHQNADIPGQAGDNTQSTSFMVTAVPDMTHLTVNSTFGMMAGDSIVQGIFSTTITTVVDSTHLIVSDTTGWVVAPILFIPTVTGPYQINVYSVGTGTDSGTANPAIYFGWTDDWGVHTANNFLTPTNIIMLTPGTILQGSNILEAVAGQPIYYSVVGGGYDAGSSYSLYITIA